MPGVGLLTATAIVAATSGEVTHFKDARHFASWFGLTPKESSSGMTRRLGRTVDALRRRALDTQGRAHHNRATCALTNKMARICYAVLRDHAGYAGVPVQRKMHLSYTLATA